MKTRFKHPLQIMQVYLKTVEESRKIGGVLPCSGNQPNQPECKTNVGFVVTGENVLR